MANIEEHCKKCMCKWARFKWDQITAASTNPQDDIHRTISTGHFALAYLSLEKYEHFLLPDRVSIAQWSEHWYIKPEALRPISAVSRGQLDNVWYSTFSTLLKVNLNLYVPHGMAQLVGMWIKLYCWYKKTVLAASDVVSLQWNCTGS